jgi:hypothetical protein
VSQLRPEASDHHGELDPLLAFDAELAAAQSAPKPVDPAPPAAALKADEALPLRLRLDQTERSLDRAQGEIAALKSNLATLVTAVDEIKKRLSRRPEVVPVPQPVPEPRRGGLLKAAALAILCLTIGAAAMWSLASTTLSEAQEPNPFDSARDSASVAQGKPIETESSVAPLIAAPVAAVPTPAVELQAVAAGVATQSDSARENASVAQGKPVREPVAPPRQGAYVGTLSIDAAPAGEVFINRQVAGRTPLRAENLRAGSHLIWIERDGYRRWTRVVAVAADRVTRVSARLDPLSR